MGNYKFRLANMMPNSWLNKLKDNNNKHNKRRSQFSSVNASTQTIAPNSYSQSPRTPTIQPNRASYYYSSKTESETNQYNVSPLHHHHPKSSDTRFPTETPRKSKKKNRRKSTRSPKLLASSVSSSGCSYRVWKASDLSSEFSSPSPKSPTEYYLDSNLDSLPAPCTCKMSQENEDFNEFSEVELPPILTKSVKKEVLGDGDKVDQVSRHSYETVSSSVKEKSRNGQQMKKSSSPGLRRLRMRANSPRMPGLKAQNYGRRKSTGLSESLAIVKSSANPQKDFRDSMMEMIVENNLRKSKDLEELLACYLSLNSNEYHDVIVKVFEQIWLDLSNIKL